MTFGFPQLCHIYPRNIALYLVINHTNCPKIFLYNSFGCETPVHSHHPHPFLPYYPLVARAFLPSFVTAHSSPRGNMRYQNRVRWRSRKRDNGEGGCMVEAITLRIEFLIKFHAF